jgi:hypothetical protein
MELCTCVHAEFPSACSLKIIIFACTKTRNNRNETSGTTGTKPPEQPERPEQESEKTGTTETKIERGIPPPWPSDLYFPRDFTNLRYRNGKRGRHGKAKRNKAIFFSNLHENNTICLLNSIRWKLGRIIVLQILLKARDILRKLEKRKAICEVL